MGDLHSLELLDVSQNPLYKIDKHIYDLPNLKDLWLLNVPIEERLVEKVNFLNPLITIEYQKRREELTVQNLNAKKK